MSSIKRIAAEGWIASAAVTASLVVRTVFWFRRDFNHDDFFAAYIGSIRARGAIPGVDFYLPNFTPAGEFLVPLFRLFPESFLPLDIARGFVLAASLLLLWITFRLSRHLGASSGGALLAVVAVTWQADFIARIADIRAEPLAALFLLGSVLALIRGRETTAGLFFGAAIAFTYKYILAGPFLLAGLVLVFGRRFRPCLGFFLGSLAAPAAYYGWRFFSDGPAAFKSVISEIASGSVISGSNKAFYLHRSLESSWFALILLLLGLSVVTWRRRELPRLFAYAWLAAGFAIAYCLAVPFIFPYTAVFLVPLLGPAISALPEASPLLQSRWKTALVGVAVLCLVFQGLPATVQSAVRDSVAQRRVIRWVWRNTLPSDHVFDWQGMHFDRPGIFHWYQFGALRGRYEGGWYSLADEWPKYQVKLLIENFRFGYMKQTDRQFMASHFVKIDQCLWAPGKVFSASELEQGAEFDAVTAGTYHISGPLLIDGRPASEWTPLAAGRHVVEGRIGASGQLTSLVLLSPQALQDPRPCPAAGEPLLYGLD